MYCLLCKEKIPRLRAWRTKSEFCSDEHAAQYKKQTLDRLLTEEADENSGAVPLPIDAPTFDDMDAVADLVGGGGAEAGSEMDIFGDLGDLADADDSGPSEDLSGIFGDGATDEPYFPMRSDGDLPGYDGPPADSVETQSAEAALAALRAIAEQGVGPAPAVETSSGLEPAETPETFGSSDDPGSLEDFLRAREDAHAENFAPAEPVLSEEEQELEAATLAPPEPTFDDEQALLAELGFLSAETEGPQSAFEAADGESAILDDLVGESDWNAEFQSELDSQVDAELETQLQEATAADVQSTWAAPEAPTDDDFEEAVMAAVEPPDEDAVPTDDDFVESMLAAVERVSEGAGQSPADVVAFPAAEARNGDGEELTREEIEASLEDAAVQVEANAEANPPDPEPTVDVAPSPKLNGSRPALRKGSNGRRAPKLKPAMVLAGVQPHALLDGEDASLETWKELAVVNSAAALTLPQLQDMQAGTPMLNGNGLRPMRPHAELSAVGGIREMLPTAILTGFAAESEGPKATRPDVLVPAQLTATWAPVNEPVETRQVPTFEGRYRFRATDLVLIEAQGKEEIPRTRRSEPFEPGGLFLDVAVDESPETATEDDGDWFADIEGFQSL